MATRLDLQSLLETLFGSRNVYYQSPESTKMEYPAIRYSKKNIKSRFANNSKYSKMFCYEIIVIDKKPDNEIITKLLELPYCSYDRHYKSDNFNHDVFTIYF